MSMTNASGAASIIKRATIVASVAAHLVAFGAAQAQTRPGSTWTEADARKDKACSALILDMGAASSKPEVTDVEVLSAIVERYNTICKGISPEMDVSGYTTLAYVHTAQRNAAKALDAANLCIAQHYRASECHVYKVRALVGIGQMDKALAAHSAALSLVNRAIADAEAALSRNPQYRGEHELKLSHEKSMKMKLDAMVAAQ